MVQKRFVNLTIFLIISVFVLALNAFPNYYAWIKTPSGMSYSGQASWFDPWDINVYVAAIRWGQEGNILLQNMFTTVQHNPILFYPLYTLSGYFFTGISPYLLFHTLAVIFGFLLLIILWRLVKYFVPDEKTSLVTLFLIASGGGVGWLFFPSIQSADLSITGFTFTSYFQRPHEALGVILYLISLTTFYIATSGKNFKANLVSVVSLIALIIIYPYYILSYGFICGLYALSLFLKDEKNYPLRFFILNTAFAFPVLLIYFSYLRSSTGFEGVVSQQLSNVGIFQIILGYGILIPLILYQLKLGKKDRVFFFLNLWFFVSLLLSFLPFGFARFYLRATFFPAVLLALSGLHLFHQRTKIPLKLLSLIFVVIIPVSSFYITYRRLAEAGGGNRWFYLSAEERDVLNFLNQNARGKGILASYTLGNYIPANTLSRVYFGHLLQTPGSQEKINNLMRFYVNSFSEGEARKFLENERISYIVWGQEEQSITNQYSDKKILTYSFLRPIFKENNTAVFSY